MKTLFTLLFVSFATTAHAHHIEGHEMAAEMPSFEACENVMIAVLNKDNLPYWAPTPQVGNIAGCYEDLRIFSQKATPKMINQFVEEYEGQIRIFNTDVEFAGFIQQNQPNFEPSAEATPVSFGSQISVITPNQPGKLFNGLFQ